MEKLNYTEIAKEVLEIESQALLEAIKRINGAELEAIVEKIFHSRGKLVVCGVGKSGLIGAKISATLSSTGTRAHTPFVLHWLRLRLVNCLMVSAVFTAITLLEKQ